MIAESLPVRLEEAKKIDDPLKRRLFVLAVITAALAPHHIRPILVGGGAVEYYTFSGYTTRDMDLAVADHQLLAQVMAELGFARQGRYWLREDLDALVEAPASTLVGEEAPLTQVETGGLVCYILGVEDLIIDRLNGYVHWHWQDDRRWVERLIVLHGKNIDWAYLRRRAAEAQTAQALAEIEKEWRDGQASQL